MVFANIKDWLGQLLSRGGTKCSLSGKGQSISRGGAKYTLPGNTMLSRNLLANVFKFAFIRNNIFFAKIEDLLCQ